jgi:galactonate dehydratase
MKITAIETFVVTTGFKPPRPWLFCAVRTDEGLTGYSEFGSDGITRGLVGLVQDLGARLIGKDPTAVEKHYVDMYRQTRQAAYGATQQTIAGIELFTVLPEIKDGQMTIPTGPGWGTELNEKAARTHAWEG